MITLSDAATEPMLGAWVTIDECFPNHNETVLVWRVGSFDSFLPGLAAITTFRMTRNGPQWDIDQHSWLLPSFSLRHVTHWMPLPVGPSVHRSPLLAQVESEMHCEEKP